MEQKNDGLLPCPFCGAKAQMDGVWAQCSEAQCIMGDEGIKPSLWNTRPQPKPLSGEVAEAVAYFSDQIDFGEKSHYPHNENIKHLKALIQAAQQPADDGGDLLGNYTGGYSGPSGPTSAPPPAAQISGMVGEKTIQMAKDVVYLLNDQELPESAKAIEAIIQAVKDKA